MIIQRHCCVFVIFLAFFSSAHAEEGHLLGIVEDGNLHDLIASQGQEETKEQDVARAEHIGVETLQEESDISSAVPAAADIPPVNEHLAGHDSAQVSGSSVVPIGSEISQLNDEKKIVQEELQRAREKMQQLEEERQRLEDEKKRLLQESAERSVHQMYIERVGENKAAEEKGSDSQNPAGRKLKESGESHGNEPKPFIFEKRRPKPADPEIVRPGGYWQAIRHSKYAHTFQMPGEQRRQ